MSAGRRAKRGASFAIIAAAVYQVMRTRLSLSSFNSYAYVCSAATSKYSPSRSTSNTPRYPLDDGRLYPSYHARRTHSVPELLGLQGTRCRFLPLHGLQSRHILRTSPYLSSGRTNLVEPGRLGQSKACQRAAWKTHKTKCQLNARTSRVEPPGPLEAEKKMLRAFTSKHRPTLAECGVIALELGTNIDNADTKCFMVCVRKRRGARKSELAYTVVEAGAHPYSSLPPQMVEEMQIVRRETNRANLQQGLDGTFFVVLLDIESAVQNNAPVGFSKEVASSLSSTSFRDRLFYCLNEGITV